VDAFRDHHQRRVSAGSNISGMIGDNDKRDSSAGRRRVSTEIMTVLEREQFWDFDVIELERVTDHHPLSSLGQKVFERWNVCEALHCPPEV
jgi:high affinity cAMP-specific and IBMX-insensitive 3',5'-cyclic phosphodiesterase 8